MTVEYTNGSQIGRATDSKVMNDGFNSEWASVTSGVPQGSVLGPVLFIIYSNDVDLGTNNLISKFADDTKIDNLVLSDEDRQSLQEDLHKVSVWSDRWEMPFNVDKCLILQAGTRNKKFDYEMRGVKLESVQCVKAWESTSRQTSNSNSNVSMQQIIRTGCWASL